MTATVWSDTFMRVERILELTGTCAGVPSLGSFRGRITGAYGPSGKRTGCRSAAKRGTEGTRVILVIKKQVHVRKQMEGREKRANVVERMENESSWKVRVGSERNII